MTELLEPPKVAGEDEESLEGSRMTLGEHLEELRTRLVRSAIAIFVSFVLCWGFHEQLGELALRPGNLAIAWTNADLAAEAEQKLAADPSLARSDFFESDDPSSALYTQLRKRIEDYVGFSPGSGFMFYLRVCVYSAVVLSGTFVLWQMWQFIAAGLYSREKSVVYRYFPLSVGLFFGGIAFGYFLMVPYGQYFLVKVSIDRILWVPKIEEHWQFLKSMCLALGFVFQLPIVMLVLSRLDLVDPKQYGRYRGHFVIVALVISAILTPPDPITQMMMATPIVILYELGVVLAKIAHRQARSAAA